MTSRGKRDKYTPHSGGNIKHVHYFKANWEDACSEVGASPPQRAHGSTEFVRGITASLRYKCVYIDTVSALS